MNEEKLILTKKECNILLSLVRNEMDWVFDQINNGRDYFRGDMIELGRIESKLDNIFSNEGELKNE